MAASETTSGYTVEIVALKEPISLKDLHAGSPQDSIERWQELPRTSTIVTVPFGEQTLSQDVTGLQTELTIKLEGPDTEGSIIFEGAIPTRLVPIGEGVELIAKRSSTGEAVLLGFVTPHTEPMQPPQGRRTSNMWKTTSMLPMKFLLN